MDIEPNRHTPSLYRHLNFNLEASSLQWTGKPCWDVTCLAYCWYLQPTVWKKHLTPICAVKVLQNKCIYLWGGQSWNYDAEVNLQNIIIIVFFVCLFFLFCRPILLATITLPCVLELYPQGEKGKNLKDFHWKTICIEETQK